MYDTHYSSKRFDIRFIIQGYHRRARVAELDAHRGLTRSVQVQIPVTAKILSYVLRSDVQ
jgi:hypothetical protein